MSDGIPITIPAERTESGEPETFHVSSAEALQISCNALNGIVDEKINGNPDFYDDHDTRQALKKGVLRELREELSEPYGRI